MKIFQLTDLNQKEILEEAEKVLQAGGIIVSPTDTVYGILGSAGSGEAIKKMFAVKKRPQEKAFPVFVKSVAEARKFAYISDAKAKFLERIWPGPITVVFEHKGKLPDILTGGLNTLGLRAPNHNFLLKLLARLDFPLAQTSANISEKPPAKNLEEIKSYFFPNANYANEMRTTRIIPELVIDAGELSGKASTVVDFTGDSPIVLRTGLVSKEELEKLFQELKP